MLNILSHLLSLNISPAVCNPRILFFLVPALIFFIPPAICAEGQRYGGQMVLATTSDPKSFNPIVSNETSTSEITSLIFEGLTTVNPFTLQSEPNLATKWDVSEDGLVWTFYLRRDVKWSDGTPFSADDVVFTFKDLIYNPDVPNSSRDVFSIEGRLFDVRKINTHTVRFILPLKFAPFLRGMSQPILPKHKLEPSVKAKTFPFTWGINTKPNEIVGTGPFQLSGYYPGERVVLQRNPHYWKTSQGNKLPYLDEVLFMIVQSADTSLLKFLDGELDYIDVRGADFPLLKPDESRRNFTLYDSGPNFGSNFIVFNQNSGVSPLTGQPFIDPVKLSWFSNLDFRRAVAHAIDKKRIIEIVNNGLGYPQHGPLSPSAGFFYNPNVIEYEYSLQKARMILAKAGFRDRNGDGILEDPQGNSVKFNLYTNSGSTERLQMAGIIRHDLAALGMQVNFLALEFNSLISKLTASFDWDAVVIGLTGGVEPHFGKNVWSSQGQLHVWSPRQTEPATEWEARLDAIFNAGVQELDETKRKILYDEFQYIVTEKLPVIYTVLASNLYALRNNFGNIKPSAYAGVLHNIEEIYQLKKGTGHKTHDTSQK